MDKISSQQGFDAGKVIIVIGGRGSGKTTYSIELINQYRGKSIVYDTNDNPSYRSVLRTIDKCLIPRWQKGNYRVIDIDHDGFFSLVRHNVWNSLIIVEDATRYMDGIIPEDVRFMVLDSKQRGNFIVFTFHSFRSIHPRLYALADYVVVLRTGEDLEDLKAVQAKLPKRRQIVEANRLANESPPGTYPRFIIDVQ